MENPSVGQTSPTLLGRLRQEPADAEDVTQMVLVRLAERMRTFEYDPSKSFRGWLRAVTRHAWSDFIRARRRRTRASGDPAAVDALETVPAREDLVSRLAEQFDQEVLEEATARVQLRVAPAHWEAFRLCAVEGLSGAEAATRLNRTVAAVFKAKARVQAQLREEIARLEGNDS